MTAKEALAKQRAFELAMIPLCGDDRFHKFLEVVAQYKEEAVTRACMHDSVRSDRATLACLGEIRAYTEILGIAEAQRQQLETRAEQAEVSQG